MICSSGEGKFVALARLSIIAGYPTVKETNLILVTLTVFSIYIKLETKFSGTLKSSSLCKNVCFDGAIAQGGDESAYLYSGLFDPCPCLYAVA